ncbi:MAG: sulfotransferase family protein [Phycisphaerales bacterium JB043]
MRELLERLPPFPTWHASVKAIVWMLGVGLALSIAQLIGWFLPVEFSVLDQSSFGGVLVIVFALSGLLMMMASEQRPLAEFGLGVARGWARRFGIALGVGFLSFALVFVLAWMFGALRIGQDTRPGRFYKGIQALPIAMVISVIFPGYLLTMFRTSYGRIVSIGACALLFALLQRFEEYDQFLTREGLAIALTLFLAGIIVCQLRLLFGTVIVPAGVLGGWLICRKLVKKVRLFDVGDAELASWFAPNLDVRQAPVAWMLLGACAIGLGVVLARRPEDARVEAGESAIDQHFKKIYPFANMGVFAPIDVWLVQLTRARWRFEPIYWLRLVATLALSVANTVLTLPERILAPLIVRWGPRRAPVFIVGVHRSGTTHLQNLMALDHESVCARTYHVINPHGFLTTGWLLVPFIKAFSPWKRPMDAVAFGIFSPNEEEYAIANSCGVSPDWAVRLPRQIERYDRLTYPSEWSPGQRRRWRWHMRLFVRKLGIFGRRPLLKNPYNTARVGELAEMYPDARFVHIHRDPYRVYRSNMHLAREGHTLFQLQDTLADDTYASRFLINYRRMEESFYQDAEDLDEGRVVDVRYEDLDGDPEGTIRAIYSRLGITMSRRYEQRLGAYLRGIGTYKKNTFTDLTEETAATIRDTLEPLFSRWERDPSTGQPQVHAGRDEVA